MKTDDGYFRGFPALWNVVALYLYAAQLDGHAAAAIVTAFLALTFAPIHVVHPFRVRDYGAALPVLALAWAVCTLALLLPGLGPFARSLFLSVSAAAALALIAMGLRRSLRGP